MMEGPLSGIRIIDLTMYVAGSSATQLLGDMGAEVIKIEPPGGEGLRRDMAGPKYQGGHFMFLAFNRNKRGVCLDLRTVAGKEAFFDLVRISDVVCDNFRPGVTKNLGADYETLCQINPRIISYSSSGYGSWGPMGDRPGYDMSAQAESGLAAITGFPGQDPVKCGPAIADLCTGIFGAWAVTLALQNRARTGKGQRVETNLMNVGVYLMTYHLVYYLMSGEVPPKLGNGHLGAVPHGIYPARDGNYVAVGNCWPRIARIIEREDLLNDPRFTEAQTRARHRDELDAILREAFLRMDADVWIDILRAEDIPAAPVNSVDKVAAHPQVEAQEMIFHLAHQLGGQVGLVNNPVRFVEGPSSREYTPPPLVGEHTDEVLSRLLGYSAEKLAELRQQQEENLAELQEHTLKRR